jgi:hypothetical protein
MEQKNMFLPPIVYSLPKKEKKNEREPSMEESRNKTKQKKEKKQKNSFRLPEFVLLNPPFNLLSYLIKVNCIR